MSTASLISIIRYCQTWAVAEDNKRAQSVANLLRESECNLPLDDMVINEGVTCLGLLSSLTSSESVGSSFSNSVRLAGALLLLAPRLESSFRFFFCPAPLLFEELLRPSVEWLHRPMSRRPWRGGGRRVFRRGEEAVAAAPRVERSGHVTQRPGTVWTARRTSTGE